MRGAARLLYFFTVTKSQHSCLLELAAIIWHRLRHSPLPKGTKLGKGDNLPSFLWSVSWPAFSLCTLLSSRLSHESVSKAPLCSSAFKCGSISCGQFQHKQRVVPFPNQYTSILNLQGLSTRETTADDKKMTRCGPKFLTTCEIILGLGHDKVIQSSILLFLWTLAGRNKL